MSKNAIRIRALFQLLRHPVANNMIALYGVQIARYLIPLVSIPYLARVLQPDGWGRVVFAQSFSVWLSLLIEFGFNLSATREISRYRGDEDRIAGIVADVMNAKGLLLVLSMLCTALVTVIVPAFKHDSGYLWLAWMGAAASGMNPQWYFQGIERLQFVSMLRVITRACGVVAIFAWVRSIDDGWKVLIIQGGAEWVTTLLGTAMMYRRARWVRSALSGMISALRMGWNAFIYMMTVSLYTTLNAFILGTFTTASQVGLYGGAEKVSKAIVGLITPVARALYPRMSHQASQDRNRAAGLARISMGLIGGIGILGALSIFGLAPILIRVVLGPGYDDAVPILRVLGLTLPPVAVGNVLGLQWMLATGMDRAFNRIIFAGGVLNIVLAVLLAPWLSGLGMALAVVVTETFVATSMFVVLHRAGAGFWQVSRAANLAGRGENAPHK